MHGTPLLQNARRPRFPPDGPSDPVVPPPRRVEAPQAVGAEPNAHGIVMTRHPTDSLCVAGLGGGGGNGQGGPPDQAPRCSEPV